MTQYKCEECGAEGCKLWRQSHVFANHVRLLCAVCAGKDQNRSIDGIDSAGCTAGKYGVSDQIGSLVPAVPTDDGSFWGYTSVPAHRVQWWYNLPSLP